MNNGASKKSSSADPGEHQNRQLWRAYSNNVARHLIALSRHMQLNLMNTLTEEKGYDGLRLNYEPFVAALAQQQAQAGMRPSQLADALGVSKQICNQILNQLEQYGYIRRVPDPDDGRAKRLSLTDKGIALARDGRLALDQVEVDYRHALDEASAGSSLSLDQFAQQLATIASGLDLLPPAIDLSRLKTAQLLGSILPPLSQYVSGRLMSLNIDRGHTELTMAHGQVLTLIGLRGGRMQQMADINNVSKQAISAIASDLEKLGYIARQSAKHGMGGGRYTLLVFTDKGWQLIEDSINAVAILEQELSALLSGKSHAQQFAQTAMALYQNLRLEEDVFDRPLIEVLSGSADNEQIAAPDLALLARQLKAHLGEDNAARLAELLH